MTTKRLILAGTLLFGTVLAAATPASAQGYYYGRYGSYYGHAPRAYSPYYYGQSPSNCDRGGPGPRVGCGSGLGIGAVR